MSYQKVERGVFQQCGYVSRTKQFCPLGHQSELCPRGKILQELHYVSRLTQLLFSLQLYQWPKRLIDKGYESTFAKLGESILKSAKGKL